jgi:hypothetical protein
LYLILLEKTAQWQLFGVVPQIPELVDERNWVLQPKNLPVKLEVLFDFYTWRQYRDF